MRSTNRTSTEGSNRWREDARASQCQHKSELRTIPTPARVLAWVAITSTSNLIVAVWVLLVLFTRGFLPSWGGHQRPSGIWLRLKRKKETVPMYWLAHFICRRNDASFCQMLCTQPREKANCFRASQSDDVGADPAGKDKLEKSESRQTLSNCKLETEWLGAWSLPGSFNSTPRNEGIQMFNHSKRT
jgi:hypothetical protein